MGVGAKLPLTSLAALTVSLGLQSCIPIIYRTAPSATFLVVDENGVAIENARVTLVAVSDPYRRVHSVQVASTDQDGRVEFDRRLSAQVAIPLPHGRTFMSWAWCVDSPGYAAAGDSYVTTDSLNPARVRLLRSSGQETDACPELRAGDNQMLPLYYPSPEIRP